MLIYPVVPVSTVLYAACAQNSGSCFLVWIGNIYESMDLHTCVPCFILYLDCLLHSNSAKGTFQRPSSKMKASCPSDRKLTMLDFSKKRGTGGRNPTINYAESFLGGQRWCSRSKNGEWPSGKADLLVPWAHLHPSFLNTPWHQECRDDVGRFERE